MRKNKIFDAKSLTNGRGWGYLFCRPSNRRSTMAPPSRGRISRMKRSATFRCRPPRTVPSTDVARDSVPAVSRIPWVRSTFSVRDLSFVHGDAPFRGIENRKLYSRGRRHTARNIPCTRTLPICRIPYIVWALQNVKTERCRTVVVHKS